MIGHKLCNWQEKEIKIVFEIKKKKLYKNYLKLTHRYEYTKNVTHK